MNLTIKYFKIGDRVIDRFSGQEGFVCHFHANLVGINFYEKMRYGHTCRGHCAIGHGYYLMPESLRKVKVVDYSQLNEIEE